MKKEFGHKAPRAITVHHFFTFLNFIVLFISVASLSFNVYILRREIESVKADIGPLVKENEKIASQLSVDYFVKSRKARQSEPGPEEVEPGPDEIEPGPEGENTTEPTEGEMTPHISPEQHGGASGTIKLNCSQVRICFHDVIKLKLS